jgi:hypothetical protein
VTGDKEIKQVWDIGLLDNEVHHIGEIVAHWGAMEHEIFIQTIMTYEELDDLSQLPKAMNNLQFSEVLELWKGRVVNTSEEKRKEVLTKQYDEINRLIVFRNALIHGMWDWDQDNLEVLKTTRIRKKEIVETTFMPGTLQDFATDLGQINMLIRYPGGMAELLTEQMEQGSYVNHAAIRRHKHEDNN